MKKWWHWLYIPRRDALALGFRYEGTLFGLPAWLWVRDDEDDEDSDDGAIYGTPKLPFLTVYTLLADCCYEVASWFMPPDKVLESPIKLGKNMLLEEAQKVRSQLKV